MKTLKGIASCSPGMLNCFIVLPFVVINYAGMFTANQVHRMIEEILRMKEFKHPHVMSLVGVCLDAGAGVSVVMPFMANGSLLDYLKRERETLDVAADTDTQKV